jgi:hypothetical protein
MDFLPEKPDHVASSRQERSHTQGLVNLQALVRELGIVQGMILGKFTFAVRREAIGPRPFDLRTTNVMDWRHT